MTTYTATPATMHSGHDIRDKRGSMVAIVHNPAANPAVFLRKVNSHKVRPGKFFDYFPREFPAFIILLPYRFDFFLRNLPRQFNNHFLCIG